MTMTMTEPVGAERAAIEAKRGLGSLTRSYTVEGVEVRAATEPDSTIVNFYGHASVTDKPYEMYGGPDNGGWNETVDGGAFKKTLSEKPDVAFLLNHAGMPLARTKEAENLHLSEDSVGLEVKAELDTRVSLANDIAILMEQRVLTEMSFAFRIVRQKWLDGDGEEVPWWDMTGTERHITEVNINHGDVSIVTYGANPFTDAKVRSLDEALRELTVDRDALTEGDIRAAIAYFDSLLPAPVVDPELEVLQLEAERRRFMARHPF